MCNSLKKIYVNFRKINFLRIKFSLVSPTLTRLFLFKKLIFHYLKKKKKWIEFNGKSTFWDIPFYKKYCDAIGCQQSEKFNFHKNFKVNCQKNSIFKKYCDAIGCQLSEKFNLNKADKINLNVIYYNMKKICSLDI